MPPHTHSGFKNRTRLTDARETLEELVVPHDRVETVALADAAGRTIAKELTAPRAVPHYRRAAMDGYAVRAEDTFGAGQRSPARLGGAETDVEPNSAIWVHTGSQLPAGADAVVEVEETDAAGEDIDVFDPVSVGENVSPIGEDVAAGQTLYEPGHRLGTADLGLLASVGISSVSVRERPVVSVLPTGEELVTTDPDPGEVVETNGRTVARYATDWGADATNRGIVTDSRDALREAITCERDRADLVVTTGGSSVGKRDLVPEVVDELGEVAVHGVGIKPGHPVAFGAVEETPILVLPGYPVSCIVTAVQLLRPAIKRSGGMALETPSTVEARLEGKVSSEIGVRSFVRVAFTEGSEDEGRANERTVVPTRANGAGVLSSVALADGWIVVPESREGIPAGELVAVQDWEALT